MSTPGARCDKDKNRVVLFLCSCPHAAQVDEDGYSVETSGIPKEEWCKRGGAHDWNAGATRIPVLTSALCGSKRIANAILEMGE